MTHDNQHIAEGDGIDTSASASAPALADDDPPPDDRYLVGATSTQDEVLAELARAEAQLHDPELEPDDASGAVL